MRHLVLALALVGFGCGGDDTMGSAGQGGAGRGGGGGAAGGAGQGGAGGSAGAAGAMRTPPRAPAMDDARFAAKLERTWLAVGDGLTPAVNEAVVTLTPPADAGAMEAWVDGKGPQAIAAGATSARLDVSMLGAGDHEIVLAQAMAETGFARLVVHRTHVLYTVVSADWDDPDNFLANLLRIEQLKDRHPKLRIAHLVGPYTYTDPMVTEQRRAEITQWIVNMRDNRGDEVGVHVHPYCNFISTTGVTCREVPSTVYPAGDGTGYTVRFNGYTEDEQTQILQAAADLFVMRGLGRPVSFRAGGWTADASTVRACQRAGYTVETSALSWKWLKDAWEHPPLAPGATLYQWNMMNWSSIDDTSQPYYPNRDAVLSVMEPRVPVLEVPDNANLADYITGPQMIDVMMKNLAAVGLPGGALSKPAVYQTGFHPPSFGVEYYTRLDMALAAVDAGLLDEDKGPMAYAVLKDLPKAFPQ